MKTIMRITRHAADTDRIDALRAAYGPDVCVVERDIEYGPDPVASVAAAIRDYEHVVAVEAIAPFNVLTRLVADRRALGVDILRSTFARGQDGRAIVDGQDATGRDILRFGGYELVERIEFVSRPLIDVCRLRGEVVS